MFAEAIEDILRDRCTPAVVRAVEEGGSPLALWEAIAGAGFLELLRPEAQGGAGLPWPELFEVLAQFGRHAVPVPAGQAIVARALCADTTEFPPGLLTLAPALRREHGGALRCPLVPFGAIADHVLAADGDELLLLPCAAAQRLVAPSTDRQCATLLWADDRAALRPGGSGAALAPMAAALHAALLAGAMARVFDMSLQFCNERSQFGRTLGKFQAVQHQLSVMAEQVAAATVAAESAFQASGRGPALLACAVAKARTSEAAAGVANTAHALHGAIGVTAEYDLNLFTRRLHGWRMAHGSEDHWHRVIGEQLLGSELTLAEFVRSA